MNNKNRRMVIILIGPPGSGKSTYSEGLQKGFPDVVRICSADRYPGLYDEKGDFHPSLLGVAHANCMKEFIEALQERIPVVVVDNTNTTAVEIAPYILVANSQGYDVALREFRTASSDVLFKRNVHKVPLETIERMMRNMDQPRPMFWPEAIVIHSIPGYEERL